MAAQYYLNEQLLLADFRRRIGRAASTIAWITMGAILLATLLHGDHGEAISHTAIWALLGVASVANLFSYCPLWRRAVQRATNGWPFYVWTGALLVFDSALVYLLREANAEGYLLYLPVVLFATMTLSVWAQALTILLALASYLTIQSTANAGMTAEETALRCATFLAIGLMGGYLAREQRGEIARRAQGQAELALVYQDLQRKEIQRGELLARVINAQEEERKRIARDLHDGPVHSISMVSLRLGGLAEQKSAGLRWMRESVKEVRATMLTALEELRRIIYDLRPSSLDDLGLGPALRAYGKSHLEANGIRFVWQAGGLPQHLAPPVQTALFRIVQEGINNIARHAKAHTARVSLTCVDGHIVVEIEDDGVGFSPQEALDRGGVGLLGMQERATLLGGNFRVESRPGQGARLRVQAPIARLEVDHEQAPHPPGR